MLGRISYDFSFLGILKTKKKTNHFFYQEEVGEKIGRMVSEVKRMTKGTGFGMKISIEVSDKKKQINQDRKLFKLH